MPLFDIGFPPNIASFLKFFMGLAALDLFTNDTIFTEVLCYVPTVGLDPYNEQFEELGFETSSLVYNLGDLSLI